MPWWCGRAGTDRLAESWDVKNPMFLLRSEAEHPVSFWVGEGWLGAGAERTNKAKWLLHIQVARFWRNVWAI
jgi:hypothetical protein